MTIALVIHVLILGASVVLGAMVFLTSPSRTTNRLFVILSIALSAWLGFLALGFASVSDYVVELCVRASTAIAAFVMPIFDTLRMSIMQPDDRMSSLLRRQRIWLLLAAVVAVFCQTPLFLSGVQPSSHGVILEPVYGPLFPVYGVFFVLSMILVILRFVNDKRSATGIQRLELQFMQLAAFAGGVFGVATAVVIPAITGSSQSAQFAPLAAFLIIAIIGYGIATKRILDVAHVLRMTVSYATLTLYLMALYGCVWYIADKAIRQVVVGGNGFPHVLAAIVVALSVAPTHGRMQQFANRIFVNMQSLDVSGLIERANSVLQSITTLDALLAHFADVVAKAVGTDRVVLLLASESGYVQRYPPAGRGTGLAVAADTPLAARLRTEHHPVVRDLLRRLKQRDTVGAIVAEMRAMDASIAIGIHSKTGMEGIMFLGPRLSGRIYGGQEQQALQLVCNQLAVAMENAQLYTKVQDAMIYNNILVDNLVSGVIAVTTDERITVFNREAQRITRLDGASSVGKDLSVLPHPLGDVLRAALRGADSIRDRDAVMKPNDSRDDVSVRLSSTVFRGHTGEVLGALLVFNDMTTLKKLEQQVRRTDRLASLGTLSAGMAHEIKNPLVTLKTFTQLLPERYDDPDFRETFSSLLGCEVKRIDSLVNQLLRFARPSKPNLVPIHLHDTVNHVLKLVGQQLRQKNITLKAVLEAGNDVIMGDNDLLVQAFLNFVLNAVEAMEEGGTLSVTTGIYEFPAQQMGLWGERSMEAHVRVAIEDTGKGIRPEDIPHVFDPFFTTKSSGTGLGLSVAHGIIHDHHGSIDVESLLGHGTTFYLFFPVARKEATV